MIAQEIKLKIHEEADLYAPFGPEQKMLSEDVSDYLIRNYKNMHRKSLEKYNLHIISDTPVDEAHVKEVIREHWAQEKSNVKHESLVETFREICLAALGVIILAIWVFLSESNEGVIMEVLSIMGWVAVWEATSIAIMKRPELYNLHKTYRHASQADIIIEVAEEKQ